MILKYIYGPEIKIEVRASVADLEDACKTAIELAEVLKMPLVSVEEIE